MMETLTTHGARGHIGALCISLGVPRASYYRGVRRKMHPVGTRRRPTPARALSAEERQRVLDELHADRFVDLAPAQVYAALLDEGRYLCAERTMYRILAAHREVRERRAQRRHPVYTAPELLATAPNQLWSWDITKLKGPQTWSWFQLYVVLDVFSRYVVGWTLAPYESGALAEELIATCCVRERIPPGQLTIHADRGAAMTAKPVAHLLADLGIVQSHSRPHVSNDNPYSEAHFKTLKYRPNFPARFGSLEDARAHCTDFFAWYNTEHYHSALGLQTSYDVHHRLADARNTARAQVLSRAWRTHPERFVQRPPTPLPVPTSAWINPPKSTASTARVP